MRIRGGDVSGDRQARGVLTGCIDQAMLHDSALNRLRAFLTALGEVDNNDRSFIAFLINAGLEARRNPALPSAGVAATHGFLTQVVRDAIARRELPPHTEPAPIVELLHAILWGIGACTGCGRSSVDLQVVTKQLEWVLGNGLLVSDCRPG